MSSTAGPRPQSTPSANTGDALELLRVQDADQIDEVSEAHYGRVGTQRPVYGHLQRRVQTLLEGAPAEVPTIYRTQAAPLASDATHDDGIDFQKYAVPGALLELVIDSRARAARGEGAAVEIVCD
ncbi:MAG: hypothetical protein ACI8PZ_004480 [Myxococcota bacterium]|jgi:hypothetical protein